MMVISLKIQQNIDLSQDVTLKNVDKTVKILISCYHATTETLISLKLLSNVNFMWFHVKAWQQECWFHLETSKMSISRSAQAKKRRFQAYIGLNVDFMLRCDSKDVDFT